MRKKKTSDVGIDPSRPECIVGIDEKTYHLYFDFVALVAAEKALAEHGQVVNMLRAMNVNHSHTLDNLAEVNVQLVDLNRQTGIAVETLAGLRLATRQVNVPLPAVATGLNRLAEAMNHAKEGMLEDQESLSSRPMT